MHRKKTLVALVTIGIICVVLVVFLIGSRAIAIFQPKLARERTANDLPDDFIGHQIHVLISDRTPHAYHHIRSTCISAKNNTVI